MQKQSSSAIIGILAVIVAAATATAQNYNPIALTPGSYTKDIIVESNAPLPGNASVYYGLNVTVGNGSGMGDNTYYEQGMYSRAGQTGGNSGVPIHNTVFTSINNANMTFRMPPDYTVNNDLMINSSFTSGALTFTTPTTATNLAVLCTGGGGSVTVNYTVTHQDSSTETGSLSIPDWFTGGGTVAWGCNGRITKDGTYNNYNSSSVNNNPPYLYALQITVSGASPVSSISFTYSSGQHASIFGVSGNNTGTWTPIAVTGFNVKAIVPASFPLTATMDQGTNTAYNGNLATWFERGYATALGYPNSGLPPANSLVTNINNSTHIYQMASSYAANNAILIDANNQTANITPANPTNYSAFGLLTAGGNIGGSSIMTNQIIMQYEDGTSETNLFYGYDWFAANSYVAFTSGGRVNMANRTLNNMANPVTSSSNPKLFESVFQLNNTASVVTNIVLKYKTAPGASSTTYVLAVSATAGAVAPVIATQPHHANIFEGTGTDFPVTLSSGTAPLAYQWQKGGANLSNGGSISGATTSNLVFTSAALSDSGNYTLVITNVAGAVTSAPIVLTVMSTSADVTTAGDTVVIYQPNGGSTPGAETEAKAIDNTTTKYLNFGNNVTNVGGAPFAGPVGFVVTPSQGSIIKAARFYTANDAPERDPADYTIEGSTDGTNYTTIASGALSLPDGRNASGASLDPVNQNIAEVRFANSCQFKSYRVSFSTVKDEANANSMQIGEVELLGVVTNLPVANGGTYGVDQGGVITIPLTGGKTPLATDADGNGTLSLVSLGTPNYGTAVITGGGTGITYTNTSGSAGSVDHFTYVVTDGNCPYVSNTISIYITAATGGNLVSATAGDGNAYLSYAGIPGCNYALDKANSITPPITWVPQVTNTADGIGSLNFTNTLSGWPTNDFFRTRYVP